MTDRIGVFLCSCSTEIEEKIDLDTVAHSIRSLKEVCVVEKANVLCSQEGRGLLQDSVRHNRLTKVVIAACSPKENETTFRDVLKEAGLSPFVLQMANIREQCAWVTHEREKATNKAIRLVKAAVSRVRYHEDVKQEEVELSPDVLVIGAGVAGMSAALSLAGEKRKVYVVEEAPCIGGKVAVMDEVFPRMECGSCLLDPMMDSLLHHQNIEVFAYTTVEEVLGYFGKFTVQVRKKPRYVDPEACIGCEACFEVCPVRRPNEYDLGLGERHAIYVPYSGSLPHIATIDTSSCLRWQGESCEACQSACPFGAINFDDKEEIASLNVGAIVVATGFQLLEPAESGIVDPGPLHDVYTALAFERMINPAGPSAGRLKCTDGRDPQQIAIVHCVGSRDPSCKPYCSGICCTYALKYTKIIKERWPSISVTHIYSDLCLPGKGAEQMHHDLLFSPGVDFIRVLDHRRVKIEQSPPRLKVSYPQLTGGTGQVIADMVVLAPAIEGARGAQELSEILDISIDKDGFFIQGESSLSPLSTSTTGIWMAGCSSGPKDIMQSVTEGKAAAGEIQACLVPGETVTLEPTAVCLDEDMCSNCGICLSVCYYKALSRDRQTSQVRLNRVLCRGCGSCVSACPSGGILSPCYTDMQLITELHVLLQGP